MLCALLYLCFHRDFCPHFTLPPCLRDPRGPPCPRAQPRCSSAPPTRRSVMLNGAALLRPEKEKHPQSCCPRRCTPWGAPRAAVHPSGYGNRAPWRHCQGREWGIIEGARFSPPHLQLGPPQGFWSGLTALPSCAARLRLRHCLCFNDLFLPLLEVVTAFMDSLLFPFNGRKCIFTVKKKKAAHGALGAH